MEGFKRLNEFIEGRTGQFLTAKTTKAWLEKFGQKKTLHVVLKNDSEILTTSKERKKHFENVDREWFEKQLKKWNREKTKRIEIATPDHPLEVITGDTVLGRGSGKGKKAAETEAARSALEQFPTNFTQ